MSTNLFGAGLINYWLVIVVTGNCSYTYVFVVTCNCSYTYVFVVPRKTPFLRGKLWYWVAVYAVRVITVYGVRVKVGVIPNPNPNPIYIVYHTPDADTKTLCVNRLK